MINSAEEFYQLRLSDNPEEYHRSAHESASEEVWHDVIKKYPHMKKWVIHNKTIHLSILEILANDTDENIRGCVANKRTLTTEIFQQLLADDSENVRYKLTLNKKLPLEMLQNLCDDKSEFVRKSAVNRLSFETSKKQ